MWVGWYSYHPTQKNAQKRKILKNKRGTKMNLFYLILLVVGSMVAGFGIGRSVTKYERGKMLLMLEQMGYLTKPFEDDDEDFK